MELTPQRGAIAIDLDRPRILFFDMDATWLLIQKYGDGFLPELFTLTGKVGDPIAGREVRLNSPEALAYFLWAGLQADAKARGEDFTVEDAKALLAPYTYRRILMTIMLALDRNIKAPGAAGKTGSGGSEASRSREIEGQPESGTDTGFDFFEAQRWAFGVAGWSAERFWKSTPCELILAQQGRRDDLDRAQRVTAHWMCLHLSALTGEAFTPAQLLGEGAQEQETRLAEAETDAAALIEKMKTAGIA